MLSNFCSNYSSTSLWQCVNIFNKNCNTNVTPSATNGKISTFNSIKKHKYVTFTVN